MTGGPFRPTQLRLRLLLLLVLPALVVIASGPPFSSWPAPDPAEMLEQRARRLERVFGSIVESSARVATAALEESSPHAFDLGRRLTNPRLGQRLEGVGILGPSGQFLEWEGVPPETPGAVPPLATWSIHVDGARTRLVTRLGPDDAGRVAVVGLVLDTPLDDLPFRNLLPPELLEGVTLDASFFDVRSSAKENSIASAPPLSPDAPPTRLVPLRSGSGDLLGVARLVAIPKDLVEARYRAHGYALATIAFVLLLALLFPWWEWCATSSGLATALLALGLSRFLLQWQEVPLRLLPRSLGGPSLYGSSALRGLLGSPTDLLLSAAAIYLACLAVRRRATLSGAFGSLVLSVLGGLTCTLFAGAITLSLVRDSRVALLERPAPLEWDARLLLWVAEFLVLIGAAQLLLQAGRSWTPLRQAGRAPLIPLGLILLALTAGAGLLLQRTTDDLALEQLATEIAPQLIQQSTLRRGVLIAAMNEIRDRYEREPPFGGRPEHLAYRLWVDGHLFHSRYKSSLDFYTTNGESLSSFAFGLPPLADYLNLPPRLSDVVSVEEETISQGAIQQQLLHAQITLSRNGSPFGVVVGHLLDEPDNLPFLTQPYLDALGPGPPRAGEDAFAFGLSYVLYDSWGEVEITTLEQPPAETAILRDAATRGERVRVEAGGQPYFGLALAEPGGRVHLLLLAERTLAERLGSIVRMALLGLALLAVLSLGAVLRTERPFDPLSWLRRSFFHRLLAAVLVASIVPLVGLALFLRGYIERRADAALVASATQFVHTAQRVIEDYSTERTEDQAPEINDAILHWLRRVVGQEIHLYRNGRLLASSKRELFSSGLLPLRLLGEVQRRLVAEGLPYLVLSTDLGATAVPVAYAQIRGPEDTEDQRVVAVPLVLAQRQKSREVSAVAEMILLATVALVGLLTIVGALLARSVARPVRRLVQATSRIAGGDYSARLGPASSDELGELVHGFNGMASALSRQRADLESRSEYIETLLRHATTGVISLDALGNIVTLNPAADLLFGKRVESLRVGANLFEILSLAPGFDGLADALSAGALQDGTPVNVDLLGEREAQRLRVARVDLQRGAESLGTLILLDDVTELMRSNQLAAWAEMARAIAHEIKNPLTPIQLSAEHLERLLRDRGVAPTGEESACFETIIKQVRALHEIAGEFSAYAKLPVLRPEPTDPVEFLRTTIEPYRASHPKGIVITEDYQPGPLVPIDRKVLARSVINLVENALHAMAGGGTLSVGVRHDDANHRVEWWVRDTGPGIDPEVRTRLFEPYFSTKSSGTGLGLAIARRSVEAHGGTIEVESPADGGATFRIHLPVRSAGGRSTLRPAIIPAR